MRLPLLVAQPRSVSKEKRYPLVPTSSDSTTQRWRISRRRSCMFRSHTQWFVQVQHQTITTAWVLITSGEIPFYFLIDIANNTGCRMIIPVHDMEDCLYSRDYRLRGRLCGIDVRLGVTSHPSTCADLASLETRRPRSRSDQVDVPASDTHATSNLASLRVDLSAISPAIDRWGLSRTVQMKPVTAAPRGTSAAEKEERKSFHDSVHRRHETANGGLGLESAISLYGCGKCLMISY